MTATSTLLSSSSKAGRRRAGQYLFRGLTILALVLVLVPAVWIVVGILSRALPHWHFSVLTKTTAHGGLSNAIVGTLIITIGVGVLAGIVGVGAGIHLSEMASDRSLDDSGGRPAAWSDGGPLGVPLDRARLRRLHRSRRRSALGLLAPPSAHHLVDDGGALHRQGHRELAQPGAHLVSRGRRCPRDVTGLQPSPRRAPLGLSGHRHRSAGGAGDRRGRDRPAALHGGVDQPDAEPGADPQPGPLPDLSRLRLLQPALRLAPLSLL